MYEFSVTVGTEGGGEQVYIVSAESETPKAAEDQIRYLVNNSLELLSIAQINIQD